MNLRRTLAALATTALVVLAAPAGGAFASHGSDDGARHGGAHHNGAHHNGADDNGAHHNGAHHNGAHHA